MDPPELQPTVEVKQLSSELLQALGEEYEENKKYEGEINKDICKRWDFILTRGLSKTEREDIIKRNSLPENCQLLDAPILNEEVEAVISESGRNRDKGIAHQQKEMGTALAIIGKIMTKILTDNDIDKLEVLKSLSESTKLLSDLHYQQTKIRRTLVSPQLDKKFLGMMENTNRNRFLYGENLGEKIKTNKQIQQSSNSIKKTVPKPANATVKNNNINRYSGNRNGPPRQVIQRQTAKPMARGGPRTRTGTVQPSQHKPTYNSHRSERGRGARYNSRK